uniref:Uncharacterized protein n=1 Tax=Physcomitrium patens TaxID=3218 RepID=A0A2K1JYB7_PHYPA|nr:hypothetical protein PHYPA_013646 [Physcomitrium patens]
MGRVRGHLFFPVDLYIVRIMPDELFHAERWAPTTSSELHRFQIRMFAEVDDFRWLQMQSEHVIILPFKQDLVVKCAALGLYAVPELN